MSTIRALHEGDLPHILWWVADPATRGHLDPAPETPADWTDEAAVTGALTRLRAAYGDPATETFVVALPHTGPLGVVTLRAYHPWTLADRPDKRAVPYIERLIVSPYAGARGKGLGTALVRHALTRAFQRGDDEVVAWIMTDDAAGDWLPAWRLFTRLGFRLDCADPTIHPQWSVLKHALGHADWNREALRLHLRRDWARMSP